MSKWTDRLPLGTAALFALFLVMMLSTYLLVKPSPPPSELEGVLRPQFKALQPFALIDQNNASFDLANLKNKWSFIFFGYTSCPDVCPMTLRTLDVVQTHLKSSDTAPTDDVQMIFVSVDPERDSTDKLGAYVSFFDQQFIGATGNKQDLDAFSGQFGAGYQFEPETSPGHYLVAHTSAVFLVDPLGRLIATFSQPHYPEVISTQYQQIREYFTNG
jgi:protein SCO1/2